MIKSETERGGRENDGRDGWMDGWMDGWRKVARQKKR